MRILMLVNWKIKYTDCVPADKQPPDYYIKGKPYWFFRYFRQSENTEYQVDVADIHSFSWLEKLEQNHIRFYIWQTLKILPKLKQYDLVLSHGMQSGIVLCLFRRLFGKGSYKHIVFDIGAFNSAREQGKSLKLMQYASKSLDGVIYHTRIQQQYYEKCHPWLTEKARYIVFGTDAEYFMAQDTQESSIHMTDSDQYILSVGYQKRDWETLISAYQGLQTKVHLRLIGNKTEGERLAAGDQRIESIAPISVVELKEQIRNARFCVLPLKSFHYSYGQMTLLQQMALGKAVIAADVPSISAYLNENSNMRYEAGNSRQLAQCMQILLGDENKCRQLGLHAAEAVREQFNERIMAEQIRQYIDEVMNGDDR